MSYAFEDFTLDTDTYELRRKDEVVPAEPQVFDVLVHLVLNRDRVVTKTELLDTVWGDQFVSESALTSRIKAARQALGDDGRAQRLIKTAHGRGYRFVGTVVELAPPAPSDQPHGVDTGDTSLRTFLFTDVESSTSLWESEPDAMREDMATHDRLLDEIVENRQGGIFKRTGDGICASFSSPVQAAEAALEIIEATNRHTWRTSTGLRIRIGLHLGEAEERQGDYFGPTVNRAARISDAASGGQILCSALMHDVIDGQLPAGASSVAHGRFQLRGLDERVRLYELVPAGAAPGPPPRAASSNVLPPSKTGKPAFGRRAQLDQIGSKLRAARVVTITGPSGIGKTHVAIHSAQQLANRYADGTQLVELANTRDPAALPRLLLDAIGAPEQRDADPLESVARALERREMLLVLDNCEHLLDAARAVAEVVTGRCPNVSILATSQEPLHVLGEMVEVLEPLRPADAISCFSHRAAELGIDVDVRHPALRSLCQRLDGIPLALELAASRARSLSIDEMVELLDDRFRLLRTRGERIEPRHATLEAALSWSWDALGTDDQQVLSGLAVFEGPFTLDDVATVVLARAGDRFAALEHLDRLVERSMLVADVSDAGLTRYHLLESIRDFARSRLDDPAGVEARHIAHFTSAVEAAGALIESRMPEEGFTELQRMWDNVRAAVRYASNHGDHESIRRMLAAVGTYAEIQQIFEVLDWCDGARLDEERSDFAIGALATVARMCAHRGDYDRGRDLARRALDERVDPATILAGYWCAYYTGDLVTARSLAEQLTSVSEGALNLYEATAAVFFAMLDVIEGRAEESDGPDRAALLASKSSLVSTLALLAEGMRLFNVDPLRAASLFEEVTSIAVANDHALIAAGAGTVAAHLALQALPTPDAARLVGRGLARCRDQGMWSVIAADLPAGAELLRRSGRFDVAARALGARISSGYDTGLSELVTAAALDELRGDLGGRLDALVAEGKAMGLPEAADEVCRELHQITGA